MNVHKNARLMLHGRERIVRQVFRLPSLPS
jgi:hypothetical protein